MKYNSHLSHVKKAWHNAMPLLVLALSLLSSCTPKKKGAELGSPQNVFLCDKGGNDIRLFSDVQVNPERMFTPTFSNPAATAKTGSQAVVLESFAKGFQGEAIAERVKTSEGAEGWVAEQNVCIPAMLVQQEEDGKNYLRDGETLSHRRVKELDTKKPVYIQKSIYSTVHNFKGCENDWYFTVTSDGDTGFLLCSTVKALGEQESAQK